MARDHAGQPGNNSKEQNQTGQPSKMRPEDEGMQQDMTDKYTEDDNELKDAIRTNHPNRNFDKGDATGQGGYKQ